MDAQLKEKIYTNGCNQSGGRIKMRCYSNYSEPGYNICICKKDEEMSNVYSSD